MPAGDRREPPGEGGRPPRLAPDDEAPPPWWMAPRQRGRTWVVGVLLLGVFVAFGGVVWLAYQDGGATAVGEVPLVEAEARPFKVSPDDPGGMEVPNQQLSVNVLLGSEPPADAPEPVTPAPAEPELAELPSPPPTAPREAQQQAVEPEPQPEPEPEPAPTSEATAPAGAPQTAAADRPSPPLQQQQPAAAPRQPEPGRSTLAALAAAVAARGSDRPAAAERPRPEPTAPARPTGTATAAVPPTVDEAEAPPAAGAPAFRIQLAAVRDEERARQAWAELLESYRDVLGGLESRIQRAQIGDSVFFRIQAGPFESREAADEACAALKARQAACIVVNG